jgi:hypothetical protein
MPPRLLELVHWIQNEVYEDLPFGLEFGPVPWWWPLPVLAVTGGLAAVAIVRLPGRGAPHPLRGGAAGTAKPVELPGILLAALGGGLAVLAVRLVRKDTPDQVMAVLSADVAFAAIYAACVLGFGRADSTT